jgi:KTSC domain
MKMASARMSNGFAEPRPQIVEWIDRCRGKVMQFNKTLTVVTILILCATAQAETVNIKYRGPIDLKPFTCTNTVSSFVNRVCYDTKSYMLILLNNTWYHYCEIDAGTVASLLSAESLGRFYNANIKGTGKIG